MCFVSTGLNGFDIKDADTADRTLKVRSDDKRNHRGMAARDLVAARCRISRLMMTIERGPYGNAKDVNPLHK
jgi:hypothetical protein